MNLLNNMKISVKIASLLAILGVIACLIGFIGSRELVRADAGYSELTDVILPDTTKLARVNRNVATMAYAAYRTMAYDGTSAPAKAAAEEEAKAFEAAKSLISDVRAKEPRSAAKFDSILQQVTDIHKQTADAVVLGLKDNNDAARRILADVDADILKFTKEIAAYNDQRIADGKEQSNQLTDRSISTSWTLRVSSIVGSILAVIVGIFATGWLITNPLVALRNRMATLADGENRSDVPGADRGDEVGGMARAVLVFRDAAQAKEVADAAKAQALAEQQMVVETVTSHLGTLADGDLERAIEKDFPREYVDLKTNFNQAITSLRQLIGSVSETAASVRTGSHEIAQASEDLARRTEGNAASLEETSAAIQQMDARLKATAEAAERSVAGSNLTMNAVDEGRSRTDQAVQAMGRVSESAKGIDSVIEGLDKIAFQTRVLAMNAAVEAGRAGDAGRGFAVVADLVSALAMRAEEEAKRARDQLTVTQTDIVAAVEAVQKVDGALTEISTAGSEAATLAKRIATDNQAQASAITQVASAISSMDQATQQNAAMVEQTSAAARNLQTEVTSLSEQASRFKVGGRTAEAPPAARQTKAATRAAPPRKAPAKPAYVSPVKALPAAAAPSNESWAEF